jgi:general secretion pathway protein F
MSAYRYKALNSAGKLVKGVLEGDSERQIRSQLRARQLRPVEVVEASSRTGGDSKFALQLFRPGLSASEVALITGNWQR